MLCVSAFKHFYAVAVVPNNGDAVVVVVVIFGLEQADEVAACEDAGSELV